MTLAELARSYDLEHRAKLRAMSAGCPAHKAKLMVIRRAPIRPSLFLSVVIILSSICHAEAMRAIPDDNLAYPVLLTLKGVGQGSGLYLNVNGKLYLVTAKHVIFDPKTGKINMPPASMENATTRNCRN
jgi:hypothetical protein